MSATIVPPASHPTSTAALQKTSLPAPSAPPLHDTLRAGLPAPPQPTHPLESRLKNWQATQEATKMDSLRRVYGLAEPIRRGMELGIVRAGDGIRLGGFETAGVHEDILRGRDGAFGWEDVFRGDEMLDLPDIHAEMERKLKMNW